MKRIISLVLVLAMCFCTMAVPAFAADVTENTARMITDLDKYTTVDEYEGYLKLYPNGSFDISIQVETPASAEIYTYQVDLTYDTSLFTCTDIGEGSVVGDGHIRYIKLIGGGISLDDAITYTFEPVNNDITTTQYYENAFTLNGVVLNEAKDSISGEDKSVAESTINIALVKQFSYEFADSENTVYENGDIDEFEKYDFTWFDNYVKPRKEYSWDIEGEEYDTEYMKNLTATADIVATVTETSTKYAVTLPDDGSLDGNAEEATYYDDYVGTIPSDDYNDLFDYKVQYQPTDGSGTWEDAVMNEDEFTIPAGEIEGPVELQVSKTLKNSIGVKVYEFVDGGTAAIMLVEVTGLDQCNFDGKAMIKSTDYNSLVYLTQDARLATNAEDLDAAREEAIKLLSSTTAQADTITRSGANGYDVNCDYVAGGLIDIYDASAAFAAAKQDYTLDATTMKLYLRADVNNDKLLSVLDYSAIQEYLLGANN